MSEVLKIGTHVRSFVTEDGGTILDTESGTYYSLNQTGAAVWNILKAEHTTKEEIFLNLPNAFDVSPEKLRADVDSFLNRLVSLRLLDHTFSWACTRLS